uniref:Uncharacterized protein n=1 Tax=Rhipicephalus zambeziensis TaxID=60191 RepID=A0A224YA26_9ACAR
MRQQKCAYHSKLKQQKNKGKTLPVKSYKTMPAVRKTCSMVYTQARGFATTVLHMQFLIVCIPWSIAFLCTFFFSPVSRKSSACVLCTHYVHILDRYGEWR